MILTQASRVGEEHTTGICGHLFELVMKRLSMYGWKSKKKKSSSRSFCNLILDKGYVTPVVVSDHP